MEDEKIIALFYARSEQAIDELDRAYGRAVRKTAANILRSSLDVEETVNDTYMGCWTSIPPERPAPLVSYVCRITRNIAVSRLRRETAAKRNRMLDAVLNETEEFIPSAMDVENELETKELVSAINHFLSALDYDERYMFVRRYWYADPVKDIAAAMGWRENRVSVRLHRLREKLKTVLEREGAFV